MKAVVRHVPERRRSAVETLLVSRHRINASVAVGPDIDPAGAFRNNAGQACDSNRLSNIMSFLPLREAFGEYCRESLCSEVRSGTHACSFFCPASQQRAQSCRSTLTRKQQLRVDRQSHHTLSLSSFVTSVREVRGVAKE